MCFTFIYDHYRDEILPKKEGALRCIIEVTGRVFNDAKLKRTLVEVYHLFCPLQPNHTNGLTTTSKYATVVIYFSF